MIHTLTGAQFLASGLTSVGINFLIPLEAHHLLGGEHFQSLGQGLHIFHLEKDRQMTEIQYFKGIVVFTVVVFFSNGNERMRVRESTV